MTEETPLLPPFQMLPLVENHFSIKLHTGPGNLLLKHATISLPEATKGQE